MIVIESLILFTL